MKLLPRNLSGSITKYVPKKNKIKKTELQNQSPSKIKPTVTDNWSKGISFSYKYFQSDHRDFSVVGRNSDYLLGLLERLRDISSWTAQELISNRSKALRCHPITWEDTTESGFGIPGEEQIVDTPYQFSICSNEHGRVHGFFIEEIFYIVWLDPDHLLYRR